ncbi:hypothetical protein [Citrobacter phage Tr1]|nr:hypothetical protein [Citrobacter phage Tr1]
MLSTRENEKHYHRGESVYRIAVYVEHLLLKVRYNGENSCFFLLNRLITILNVNHSH